MMRIIGGELRSRRIPFNNRKQGNARVTSDFVKKAVFSSLGEVLTGLHFLDLFACSGQIGLEAYSRGARVVMNEADHRRHRFIVQMLADWHLSEHIMLHNRPAQQLLPRLASDGQVFDVVYLDPPYHEQIDGVPMAVAFLERVAEAGILTGGARVVVQHDVRVEVPGAAGALLVVRQKDYGDTTVTMYG